MNEELNNILLKVQELYKKYGIKSITMDDVAKHLAISKKTLYHYVCDKTDLVSRVIELELEQNTIEMEKALSKQTDALETIMIVFNLVKKNIAGYNPSMNYDLQKYYPELHKHYWQMKKKKIYQAIKLNIRQGIREGLFRDDVNGDVIAKIHIARLEGLFTGDFIPHEEAMSPLFISETFIYHIRGVASEKGLAQFLANSDKLDLLLNNTNLNNLKIS